MPDEALESRLSRDLDGVFAEVVDCFEGAVFTTALRVSGRADEAEDLAAETFLRAYAALRRYSPERIVELQLRPWLITICLNLWRNRVRAASRLQPPLPVVPLESPEERAQRRDVGDRLASLLLRLPEKQRIAVVLRHIVGFSSSEIADALGCPTGTAKSHVSRGLDQLRIFLSDNPEVLP